MSNWNQITDSEWEQVEAQGVVFLPAAGYRYGNATVVNSSYTHNNQLAGSVLYWSSTHYNATQAYNLFINNNQTTYFDDKSDRAYACAVRLVADVQ